MREKGWISVHRKITENWIWEEKPFSKGQAWIDLLLMVNHQDNKTLIDGNLVIVNRGSRITSLRKLSEKWGWSRTKTKKFLELLEKDEMITFKSDSKKTVYTIVNYNDYQDTSNNKNDTEVPVKDHRSDSEVTLKDTNNNDNNENNVNNVNKKQSVLSFISDFSKDDSELLDALLGFKEMRDKKKAPLTPRAIKKNITELKKISSSRDEMINIIDQSTMNSWSGFYPIKNKQVNNKGGMNYDRSESLV